MIPLMVDCRGRRVVIFGGGEVAARKAAFFSQEAAVRVVSRTFLPLFDTIPADLVREDLTTRDRERIAHHLAGSFLAVAATSDPEVNRCIGDVCRQIGVLFNDGMGESGNVIVPSVVRGKEFLVAVTTFGKAPTVPRFLREHLEAAFPDLDSMVLLQEEFRKELKADSIPWNERAAILHRVLSDRDVWAALARSRAEAHDLIRRRYVHG